MEDKNNLNFIQHLQYLVRNEISTRETLKRNNDILLENFEKKIKEIYSARIKILSEEKINETCFKLDENNSIFLKNAILKQTIEKFFLCVRKDPELIYKILTKLQMNEIKIISPFIMNNFYENILSPYKTEDELLLLIYKLLELEINDLNSPNDINSFLNETKCGILLKELCSRLEVKEFFNIILEDILSRIENQNEKEWDFSIENLQTSFKLKRSKDLLLPETFSTEKESLQAKFNKNYFSLFNKNILEDTMKKFQNNELKQYYEYIIEKFLNKNPNLYTNFPLIDLIFSEEDSEEILNEYIIIFYNIKQAILLILNSLNDNINLIPYSLKSICKMISILIKKKFKNIGVIEEKIFISKFFFITIFKTIILEPDTKGLISSFIISQHTTDKIKIILKVLEELISFKIFNNEEDKQMTPFNWFFLSEAMPIVLEISNKLITNISFSNYIDKLTSNEIEDNDVFSYDYFNENPNSKMVEYTICYQPIHFKILVDILQVILVNIPRSPKKNETKSETNRRVLVNILSKFTISSNKNFIEQQFLNSLDFYLVIKSEISPKYSHLANIEETIKPYKNNIKKTPNGLNKDLLVIENYICELLFRFPPIDKRDFTNKEFSFLDFLEEIKKFGNINDDMSIPFEWYSEILYKLLTNLPLEYKENNYSKVLNMIKTDLTNSIKLYKKQTFDWNTIELVSKDLLNKLKKNIVVLEEIKGNKKIMSQIKTINTPIKMNKSFSSNFDVFEVNQLNQGNPSKGSKIILCNNIDDFIKNFPDFVSHSIENKISLFELEKKCRASDVINKYINILKASNQISNEEKFKKYIYSSLYSKMLLNQGTEEDFSLYKKCISLSWVEMSHLDKNRSYFFYSNFIVDANRLFSNFDNENSPIGKIKAIIKIETLITKILIFNGIDVPGEDDKTPLRLLLFIQGKPKKFVSSINYLLSIDKDEYSLLLTNYFGIQETLTSNTIKYEGITPEEYKIKCEKAIKNWCNE